MLSWLDRSAGHLENWQVWIQICIIGLERQLGWVKFTENKLQVHETLTKWNSASLSSPNFIWKYHVYKFMPTYPCLVCRWHKKECSLLNGFIFEQRSHSEWAEFTSRGSDSADGRGFLYSLENNLKWGPKADANIYLILITVRIFSQCSFTLDCKLKIFPFQDVLEERISLEVQLEQLRPFSHL